MDTPLKKYKNFIDDIVNIKSSVHAIKTSFKRRERDTSYGQLASRLAKDDRDAVLKLISEVAEASVHDVLFKLVENQVRLQIGDTPLPDCPFGTSLHEDWATRVEGIPWPDED